MLLYRTATDDSGFKCFVASVHTGNLPDALSLRDNGSTMNAKIHTMHNDYLAKIF